MSANVSDVRSKEVSKMNNSSEATGLTFAVAVNDKELFETNLRASPCFRTLRNYQLLAQENYSSAAKAYNDAIDKSVNDLIIFTHQDMIFPESWLPQLENALEYLGAHDPNWGVLGVYGKAWDGTGRGHVYSSGRGIIGEQFEIPAPIQTLDEIVLIVRKSSGLRFDDQLPHFHLYGSEICLTAAKKGLKSYAVSAFCVHNAQQKLVLPKEFYECYRYLRRAWKAELPIETTCITITRSNIPLYLRRLRETYQQLIGRDEITATREKEVQHLLQKLASTPVGPVNRPERRAAPARKGSEDVTVSRSPGIKK
jgi:hypothetical protein